MPLSDILPQICNRPILFVGSDSFKAVADYLIGYDDALREYAPDEVKATSLLEFGRWLSYSHMNADRIWRIDSEEVPVNLAWCGKVQRLYPDDSEALQALPVLYQQFLDDPRRAAWPDWPDYQGEADL